MKIKKVTLAQPHGELYFTARSYRDSDSEPCIHVRALNELVITQDDQFLHEVAFTVTLRAGYFRSFFTFTFCLFACKEDSCSRRLVLSVTRCSYTGPIALESQPHLRRMRSHVTIRGLRMVLFM